MCIRLKNRSVSNVSPTHLTTPRARVALSSSSASGGATPPRAAPAAPVHKTFFEKTLANTKKSAAHAKKGGTAARPGLRASEMRVLHAAFESAPGRKRADQHQLGELTGTFNAARETANAAAAASLEQTRAEATEELERARLERRSAAGARPVRTLSRSKRTRARAATSSAGDAAAKDDDDDELDAGKDDLSDDESNGESIDERHHDPENSLAKSAE